MEETTMITSTISETNSPPMFVSEFSPDPTSTPSPPTTESDVKKRKSRGPDKKPRKKKSDAGNLLLPAAEDSDTSSSTTPNPLEDDVMTEVRKLMNDLLDTIAPKKRKRGPNKNPRVKKAKLDEIIEETANVAENQPVQHNLFSIVPHSFSNGTVPPPQQSFSFVEKTVEELLPNWNFNNYILGLPYQLANPREVSLRQIIQEATEKIKAFNLLTDPSSSTYNPTLNSKWEEKEVSKPGPPALPVLPQSAPVMARPKGVAPVIQQHIDAQNSIQMPHPHLQMQRMHHSFSQSVSSAPKASKIAQPKLPPQPASVAPMNPQIEQHPDPHLQAQQMQQMQHHMAMMQQQQMMEAYVYQQFAQMQQANGQVPLSDDSKRSNLQAQTQADQNLGAHSDTSKPLSQAEPVVPMPAMHQMSQMTQHSVTPNPQQSQEDTPVFQPLAPLNVQNLQSNAPTSQNLTPLCTSSGRTTATLTPALHADSDASNNSSPTC